MPARKRFGQHFLHDPGVIERLLDLINPQPGEQIIEIGPGRGALTLPLLRRIGKLQAVELDRDLIPSLQQRATNVGELTIHQADALRVNYADLAQGRPMRLVGNLPYNISSPLLFKLLASDAQIVDMHFMLQREVVDRLVAAPGSRVYGRLSVAVAARAHASNLMHVGPGAFQPPPRVESAIVRLLPRAPAFHIADMATFNRVVTQAFSQRRKTLRNALSGLVGTELFVQAGIDAGLRAEVLAPADFAALSNCLSDSAKHLPGAGVI